VVVVVVVVVVAGPSQHCRSRLAVWIRVALVASSGVFSLDSCLLLFLLVLPLVQHSLATGVCAIRRLAGGRHGSPRACRYGSVNLVPAEVCCSLLLPPPPHTHTHAHTHTRKLARTRAHTHTQIVSGLKNRYQALRPKGDAPQVAVEHYKGFAQHRHVVVVVIVIVVVVGVVVVVLASRRFNQRLGHPALRPSHPIPFRCSLTVATVRTTEAAAVKAGRKTFACCSLALAPPGPTLTPMPLDGVRYADAPAL
jgi:hypothetical protein